MRVGGKSNPIIELADGKYTSVVIGYVTYVNLPQVHVIGGLWFDISFNYAHKSVNHVNMTYTQ